MSPVLFARQQTNPNNVNDPNNGGEEVFVEHNNDWWFSPTAVIVKWSILGALILFFTLWFVGGSIHARRRIKKGLPPLRYHRFLAPADYQPERSGPQLQADFYRMDNMGYPVQQAPPPQYPHGQVPAAYPADTKVDASQDYDVPPPGPPPSHQQSANSSEELPPREPKSNKATGILNRMNPLRK